MIAFAVLLAAAGPDTAVVARSVPADEAAALRDACAARFSCAPPEQVAEAMADAVALGISCADDDATCWQRFLAAEGFARALIATRRGETMRVTVVGLEGALKTGEGPSAAAALEAAFAPPVTSSPPTTDPPSPPTPPTPPPPAPDATPSSGVAFTVAGVAGALAVGAGAGAAFVSADISRSLDDAAAGQTPLTGYAERNALFFSLVAASAVTAVTAVTAVVMGLGAEGA